MSKILLFDFDGTIADSFDNFLEIINKLSIKYNLPALPPEELEKLRSEEAKAIIKRLKIPFYKIPFIANDMKKMQQQQITQIKPFKDLPEVLHALKDLGYVLGIITSNGEENVKRFVKHNNVNIFSYIHGDTSIFGKDKVIHKFLKQHTVAKEDVIYIGDEIRDIQACQKVGIKIIAVTWGLNSKEGLANYHPDFLIDTPAQLLKLLEGKTK